MHCVSNGTIVPKSLDSPGKPPNFNVPTRRKAPVIGITLSYLGAMEWGVTFFRDRKPPKTYSPSLGLVTLLTKLVNEFHLLKFVDVAPGLTGWTAYVDRAVYPPPKVSDETERDAFGVPYNKASDEEHPCRCADTRICPNCDGDKVEEIYGLLCICQVCDGKGDCPYCRPKGVSNV